MSAPASVTTDVPAAAVAPSTGGKKCSACEKTLHISAFSGTQAKAPAKSRKCMECVIHNKPSVVAADETVPAAAVATAASSSSSSAAAPQKKKSKANTPGAIARERAAARTGSSSQSSKSSSSAAAAGAPSVDELMAQLNVGGKNNKKKVSKSDSGASGKKDSSGQVALLDDDDEWFLPTAESALEEVFRRFDLAHKNATPPVARDDLFWTLADIQSFAMATNGAEFGTQELLEIRENLEHDDEGRLTCQGFLDFYHLQTTSHPDETWKDLKKLGYDSELKLTKQ